MEKENSDKWLHCRKSAISRNYFSTFFIYFWEESVEKGNSDKWLHCRKSAIKEKQWIVCYLASTLISRRSIMHHAAEKTNDKRDLFVTVGNIYQKCIGKIHLFLCAPFMVCMCILISVKFYLLLFLTCQWWFVHSFYLISLDFCEIFPATLSLLLLADLCIVYCCELLHPICSKLTFVGATFPHNICRIWTVKTHFKIAFCEAAKPHF